MKKSSSWAKFQDERSAKAVEAAKNLFLERKIDSVRMTEIAERTGIGVASLYRYFETKENIVISAAILLWSEIKKEYLPRFHMPEFQSLSGIAQLKAILDAYSDLIVSHREFLLFLSDFDSFCLEEQIPKEKLADYEKSTADFYEPYKTAIEKGQADGTVSVRANPDILYLSVNHTMLALLMKMAGGEITGQDNRFTEELDVVKDIMLHYFENKS